MDTITTYVITDDDVLTPIDNKLSLLFNKESYAEVVSEYEDAIKAMPAETRPSLVEWAMDTYPGNIVETHTCFNGMGYEEFIRLYRSGKDLSLFLYDSYDKKGLEYILCHNQASMPRVLEKVKELCKISPLLNQVMKNRPDEDLIYFGVAHDRYLDNGKDRQFDNGIWHTNARIEKLIVKSPEEGQDSVFVVCWEPDLFAKGPILENASAAAPERTGQS